MFVGMQNKTNAILTVLILSIGIDSPEKTVFYGVCSGSTQFTTHLVIQEHIKR